MHRMQGEGEIKTLDLIATPYKCLIYGVGKSRLTVVSVSSLYSCTSSFYAITCLPLFVQLNYIQNM